MSKKSHIYVIGTRPGPFKIGIATNIKDRLSSIQTGSHVKMAVLYSVQVPHEDAYKIEGRTHKSLREKWVSGEWFSVSLDDAERAITESIRIVAELRAERHEEENPKEEERPEPSKRHKQPAIITVPGVTLVQKRTLQEFLAENDRIQAEKRAKLAPRKAFVERMAEGRKRAKQLKADTAALQDWMTVALSKRSCS